MENVMTNGFTELSENEMFEVEGGIGPAIVIAGIIALGFFVCGTKGCADADAGK